MVKAIGAAFGARAGTCALVMALAACAQPGMQAGMGAGQPRMGQPGAPMPVGPAASGPAGAPLQMPRLQMPQIQMPVMQVPGAAGQPVPGQAAPGRPAPGQQAGAQAPRLGFPWVLPWGGNAGAAAAPGTVRDPFAGQGVRQPAVEPPRGQAAAAKAVPAGTAPAARTHSVVAGETAWSIARKYGVTIQELARANGLPESMSVRVGQTLTIPGGASSTTQARVTAPGTGSPTPQPPSSSRPLPSERTTPASQPAPRASAPDLGQTRTAASGSGRFAMPVNGAIIRPYSKGTNEGIDISAPAGSPVKAASGGTVAAITRDTEGVPIVVVRHDGGLMTVYAGLGELSIAKGDNVSAGQTIGTTRSNGVVHFEVRKGFDSVDPEDYL